MFDPRQRILTSACQSLEIVDFLLSTPEAETDTHYVRSGKLKLHNVHDR